MPWYTRTRKDSSSITKPTTKKQTKDYLLK